VLTTHYNVTRVVRDTNYIDIKPEDRFLQLSNYAFDGSVFDIYGALLNGSALVLIEKDDVLAVERLAEIIKREAITVFFVTTALFNTLVDLDIECLHGIRKVLFGGERVSIEHSGNALAYLGKGRVIHVYGPTETTVYAAYYFIDGIADTASTIPIGKPISNTTIYVLDKHLKPLPIGASGELYIGGTGTARGYVNSPELTAEKFLFDFSKKLYKTGDLGRWLPDGNIEFIGRIDHQVKIRGLRIELGEIESQLLTHDEIKEVVVISKQDQQGSSRGLCAYFVSDNELSTAQLREYLSKSLPGYMVPSYFIRLDRIPLTPNGKVDQRALPEPGLTVGENYAVPRDKIEKELVRIWSRVLSKDSSHESQLQESIGIDDNFFELGGHSLKAARLMSRIYSVLNVKVPLTEIFRTPSIRGLAGYISETAGDRYVSIEPVEEREYYPLSPAQKRLCVLQQTNTHDMSYNMPRVMELEGELVTDRLEDIFKKLTARHESIRTSFETRKGELVQRVYDHIEFEVERLAAAAEEDNIANIIRGFVRPFDLSRPPLLRVGLINTGEQEHILMVDMHHIVTDGSSMGILVREFMALQTDEGLPPLRTRYKDFSIWMNGKSMKESIKKQEQYWLKEFAGEVPVLRLYTDEVDLYRHSQSSSPGQWSLEGKRTDFELEIAASQGLMKLANEEGVTLYMVLLAIYNVFLFKLSGQEDIVVGTVTAGRSHPDLQPVMGMFVNTLALRNYPGRKTTFRTFLKEVKERTLEAFENQAYPFEELAEKVAADRDSRRNPLFDVMFALQNLDIPEVEIPGLTLKPYAYENVISKFDLTLYGVEEDNKLLFIFEYRTQRFNQKIIGEFVSYFKDIIGVVLDNKDIKLADIDLSGDFSDSGLETEVLQEFSGDFGF
jgi:non-ribosomal peptide synthetase component F/acyl carrier protein